MILRRIAVILPLVMLMFALGVMADTIVDYTYDKDGTMINEAINSSTPPEVTITADNVSLDPGGSTTLNWTSTNATSCEIDQGIGTVDLNGSISISPTYSTKYTITATGPGGVSRASVIVGVIYPQPTLGITATPEIIILGQSTTLSWDSANAETAVIDNGVGPVPTSGTFTVSPTEDTIYTLFVNGPGGASASTVLVTVIDPNIPPSISIHADPEVIVLGESTTLTWSSRGADTATINNGIGTVPVNGSLSVSPTETTTYTITVNGIGGQNTSYATVIVLQSLDDTSITNTKLAIGENIVKAVSISGDYAAVGIPYYDDIYASNPENGVDAGAVYIFKREESGWVEHQLITVETNDNFPGDNFGMSVSIDGNYLIIGAPGDEYGWGTVYIFERDNQESNWVQQHKLTDLYSDITKLGLSVSINKDYAIVGFYSGVHIYVRNSSTNTWSKQVSFINNLNTYPYSYPLTFGCSVSIDGDYAIVGAPNGLIYTQLGPAVYIFKRDGTSWTQQAMLTPSDWSQDEFWNNDYEDEFGCSVAISGDYVIVGRKSDSSNGTNSGSAYIYKRNGSEWTQEVNITASDANEEDQFGGNVSINGNYAVVGAIGDDDSGADSGAAYIFKRYENGWTEQEKLIAEDGTENEWFGNSTSIKDGRLIVGSGSLTYNIYYPSLAIETPGYAYIYSLVDVTLNADPVVIQPGESSTLSWISNYANTVVIDNGIGSVDLNGSLQVSPTETTTYRITATSQDGSVAISKATVVVGDLEFKNYVLNPNLAGSTIQVVSLENDNVIIAGSTVLNLSKFQSGEIPANAVSSGGVIEGLKPFTIGSSDDETDMPVPASFAGTQFVIPHVRNSHTYYILCPSGNAQVQINVGAGPFTITAPQGQMVTVDAGSNNEISGTVISDLPILISHAAEGTDVFPVHPVSMNLVGVKSKGVQIGALESNTTVTAYASDGTTTTILINTGEKKAISIGANTEQGMGDSIHITADKPVMAIQYADGDGGEATCFFDISTMAKKYCIPLDSQYIAVVGLETDTIVTLYDNLGNQVGQQVFSSDGTVPGKAYFGSEVNGTYIPKGSRIKSTKPIYVIYEPSASNDEHNLLGTIGE